jgi:hypothetical protein
MLAIFRQTQWDSGEPPPGSRPTFGKEPSGRVARQITYAGTGTCSAGCGSNGTRCPKQSRSRTLMTLSSDPATTLATLGEDAWAHERMIRMANASRGKPPLDQSLHAVPGQMVTLTATAQHRPPQAAHCRVKGAQRRTIHRHHVIAEVTEQERAQVCSLFPNGRVQASPQFLFQGPQLGLPSLPHRWSPHREEYLLLVRSRACISRFNTRPVRPPVNASRPSRAAPHDSGPLWFSTPSTYEIFFHYTLPVSTGARRKT